MSQERQFRPMSGWLMLLVAIVLACALIALFAVMISREDPSYLYFFVPMVVAMVLVLPGFLVLQPNQSAVLLLFGNYVGTARDSGFFWANPFFTKKKLSLRLRNLNSEKIKVNDAAGNPIEIAAVMVWKVEDTYAASFDVDDYEDFVRVQSEAALRHLATQYPYDCWEDEENPTVSLRGNIDQVSVALEKELLERLGKAGVLVHEARLSHLAYASEIAEAMLRRQQAHAIVAARKRIVEGAVGMVRMALDMLSAEKVVELDDERRAAMVSNLLVVLCGESHAQPIVNAGTLYH